MKDKTLINALAIVLIVFFVSLTVFVNMSISNIGKSDNFRNTISVSGEGEVFVRPDTVSISLSVFNEDRDPREAMRINSQNSEKVIAFLKDNGIEDRDIKTVSFDIFPRYEFDRFIENPIPGNRNLVGYQITHSLQVKIRDIDNVGPILEGAVGSGANQVYGIQFIVDDERAHKEEARNMAIEKAKEDAQKLAKELGVKLSRIVEFNESSSPVFFRSFSGDEMLGLGGESAPDIQSGENRIVSNVYIVYEIK